MNTLWVQGLERGKPTDLFIDGLKHSLVHDVYLKRLRDIIDEELQFLARQEATLDDYQDASWSHKQAHRNGQVASLNKIRTLITLKETE